MDPGRSSLVLATALVAAGCAGGGPDHRVDTEVAATITVSSTAFAEGEEIPERFTCDGDQVSPPLRWSGGSAKARALVVDDPDASGTFVHWVVVDIPAGTTRVAAGDVPAGGTQVTSSAGDASYTGPCPPSGTHHYRFTVYALDAPTGLTSRASLDDALTAIGDHATARGTLTAVYSRQ